jgi:hypothetical protein
VNNKEKLLSSEVGALGYHLFDAHDITAQLLKDESSIIKRYIGRKVSNGLIRLQVKGSAVEICLFR